MNLYDTVELIKELAKKQPNVNLSYEGDVYDLNSRQDISYAAVVITQTQHRDDNGMRNFGFSLIYTDRLTDDKSNRLQIQSVAIEALSNIVAGLNEIFDIEEVVYQPFTEKFDSECAGCYATLTLRQPIGICEEEF